MTADVDFVRLVFVDNSGIIRGKLVDRDHLADIIDHGATLPEAIQAFTARSELVDGGTFDAVGEVRLQPDLETFTELPYADRTGAVLCDIHTLAGDPWAADPRSRLQSFIEKLDWQPRVAFETEFYLFEDSEAGPQPFDQSTVYAVTGMNRSHDVVLDVVDALEAQGLHVLHYYPEVGPGQHEIVTEHRPGVTSADEYVQYRSTVDAVTTAHDLQASFRPLPVPDAPGNGLHLHLSLWRDGENCFYDQQDDDPYALSERGRQFIAGVLDHAPALTALTAPSTASYGRLQPNMFASAFACWGRDNREAAVRVPSSHRNSRAETTRIEYKPADNTANPYLALLGVLAAGKDGIDRDLDPGQPATVDPATLSEAERDQRGIERLPENLGEALDALATDTVLEAALGETLYQSYLEVKGSLWEASPDDGEWTGDYLSRGF